MDKDGKAIAEANQTEIATMSFSNKYEAKGSITLEATKALSGKTLADGAFSFTLTGNGQNQSKSNVGDTVTFDALSYDQDDIGQTYTYTVKEVIPNPVPAGYTYDKSEYEVAVTVVVDPDDASKLAPTKVIKKVVDKDGNAVAEADQTEIATMSFSNSYAAVGKGEVKVQKVLEGRDWTDDDEFTFTISAAEGTPMPATTSITIKKSDTNQTKSFGEIEFTKAGDYTYTVKETKGTLGGVTYDETERTVTIKTVDDGKGNIIAAEGSELIQTTKITNTYAAKGLAEIKVQKVLEGREWKDTDTFTFTLTAVDDAPMPKEDTEIAITNKDQDHTKSFGEIEFTKAGKYSYKVKETKGDIKGLIYDETEHEVTFDVKDDGKGNIVAVTEGEELVQAVTVTNKAFSIKVKKVDVSSKEELEGAKIVLLDESGAELDSWTSEKGVQREIAELIELGKTYTLRETVAPLGYAVTTDINFTLNEDGTVSINGTTVTDNILLIEDDRILVNIRKFRSNNGKKTERFVEDATLTIHVGSADGEVATDCLTNAPATWKTTDAAHQVSLATGSYVLVEEAGPSKLAKYWSIAEPISFTVTADGKVENVSGEADGNTITMYDEFNLTLYEEDEEKAKRSGTEVTETPEEKRPSTPKVTKGGEKKPTPAVTKEVTKTKSVKTGDENNMALPFAAGALALIAIAFILIEEKKRRRV